MPLPPIPFTYRGQSCELRPVTRDGLAGHIVTCPKCGTRGFLDPRAHSLTLDSQGLPTAHPSLVCDCGWHVWLRDGVATDC